MSSADTAAFSPVAQVEQHATSLTVQADDATLELPHLWLRDNCSCDECRISQTGEKKFLLSSVPADIAPKIADIEDDRLRLVWPDGHRSVYHLDHIRALRVPRHAEPVGWSPDYEPRRIDWSAFLEDDSDACDALTHFMTEGALILTGAPARSGSLEDLAPRLGPIREVLFDRIHDVQVDPQGYNVAHTTFELPPHNDFASYSWQPSVQALHMLENEASGGNSIIVDGLALLAAFRKARPDDFQVLVETDVPFREFDAATETFAAAPLVRLDSNGKIVGLRFSNQLMQTMDPTRAGVDAFYRAYHALCTWIEDPAYQARFRLAGGDVLIVAAHRVLHAREAFEADGARHLQDAYFELDNAANMLVRLRRGQQAIETEQQ